MISDETVDRYYYIFDSRERRPLVVDRCTGEEVAWGSVPRVRLIDHVAEARSRDVLRRFARWCARQTGIESVPSETTLGRLWDAATTGGEPDREEQRRPPTDAVVEAVTLGLPRRQSDAARLLAAHACLHPKARQAAIEAAHMSERWAEFEAEAAPEAAVRALRQRQVDWLLDELGT